MSYLRGAGGFITIALVGAMFVGWLLNIVKIFGLIGSPFNEVGVELVIRIVSVFVFFVGAVAGYIG